MDYDWRWLMKEIVLKLAIISTVNQQLETFACLPTRQILCFVIIEFLTLNLGNFVSSAKLYIR